VKEREKRFRFLWGAHPLWALAEAWLLALLVLFLLSRVVGQVQGSVFGNGTLVICGLSGLWVTVRARIPGRGFWLQVLWELGVGVALSLQMAVGLLGLAYGFGSTGTGSGSGVWSLH
jgi:hypothetical protein